jgi:glucose-6-phosphate-specific signal transduction histidine kinase
MSSVGTAKLTIHAAIKDDYLILSVEDNGIVKSGTNPGNYNEGKGLKLTNEFYDILNQINKRPIRHTITNLYVDGTTEISGTKVEIWVPVQ